MNKSVKGTKKGKSTATPNKLTKPKGKGQVELSEDELKRVSGGGGAKNVEGWIEF